jgi:GAF domain-containing protein
MTPTATHILGLNGLALAWESVAVVLGALFLGLLVGLAVRARTARSPAAARSPERERELESLRRIAAELARTSDVEGVARTLLDEIGVLFEVGFAGLAFVSEDAREASGFLARAKGEDVPWWPEVRVDLTREPSGIASAAFEAVSFAVYDVESSSRVSSRLARDVGAKSAAFVPLISEGRVTAVISVATTDERRAFSNEDLSLMQTLASEATIALERTRGAIALAEALERDRLLASIGRRLRTDLDLEPVLGATVEETGRALGALRCFVRVDGHVVAHWSSDGSELHDDVARGLPVSNLAFTESRTVAVSDIQSDPEFAEPALEPLDPDRALHARAVAATPIAVGDETVGVLAVSRTQPRAWSQGDTTLLEAVAAEVGLSLRLGRLLTENRERRPGIDRGPRAEHGARASRPGGRGAPGRGCLRLLPLRRAARRLALRGGAGLPS